MKSQAISVQCSVFGVRQELTLVGRHHAAVFLKTDNRKPRTRSAVTLMETIFAIGVILTGLVGLAALIPVAANNAQATLEIDRSISESTSAAAAGLAKNYTTLSTLVMFDEPLQGSLARPNNPGGSFGFEPTENLETVRWKVSTQTQFSAPTLPIGKLESPGYGHHPFGAGLVSGLCLDPLGLPDPALQRVRNAGDAAAANSGYSYSRFPYYSERYNVLAPPNAAVGSPGLPTVWPMSPRMWRVTLKSPTLTVPATTSPLGRAAVIPALTARLQFRGFGGLGTVDGSEEGDPRSLLINSTVFGTQRVDSSSDGSSEYSWIATYAPSYLGGDNFRQSIVVIRQRISPVPTRSGDPLALNLTNYTITDADDNPRSERLTWVGDAIGFTGGAGGEVHLYGSQSVSDDIREGEWVMLSRQIHTTSGAPAYNLTAPTGAAVHRWFRVLRVEDTEFQSGFTMPGGGGAQDVWHRWVTLAGPDWAFQDQPFPGNSPLDDTFCTIISGAVSVIESDVVLQ